MSEKHNICEVLIKELNYPNVGMGFVGEREVDVKNVIPEQLVEVLLSRKKRRSVGKKLRVITKAPYEIESLCPDFEICGGCTYQNISYDDELHIKESMVLGLVREAGFSDINYLGMIASENQNGYRNKMEFSFGDDRKGGSLALGVRKRDNFYEVVTPINCNIIDHDFKTILLCVLDYFKKSGQSFYHRITKEGNLRHLIVRKAFYSGEILVNLVTRSGIDTDLYELSLELKSIELNGTIMGFIHTTNDSLSDTVYSDKVDIIHGIDYITENLLGLSFRISPFSFFQTNSVGAQQLYSYVVEIVKKLRPQTVYDLYCGTGTMTQLVAKYSDNVIGVEIVSEAVESAQKSAAYNGVKNCNFIVGDVLDIIDEITASGSRPNLIILDPPRDGLHPKAIKKIINLAADFILYISCKPTSLVRDMRIFSENGYSMMSLKLCDLFPRTYHVESVMLMSKNS